VRRAAAAFVAAPFVAGCAALVAAALPAAAWWAGTHMAPALREADPALLALGAGLAAALAGGVVTLLAPGARALGSQLEAAPIPRVTALLGLRLLAPATALILLALPVVLFAAPAARGATPIVLARLVGAAALGGTGVEAALALARRSHRGVPVVGALALLLLARGSLLAVPFAIALWIASLAARPDERAPRATVRIVARRRASATAMRYARRRDLRRQATACVALAVVGAASLRATGVPNEVAVAFGGATALLGAAVVPLAAPGLDRRAEWLWRSAPTQRSTLALLHGSVALCLGIGVAAVGIGGALAAAPAHPAVVLPVAAGAAVVLGAAQLGGSLVPWRPDRLAEQLGAYAAFGVVLSMLFLVLAWSAPLVGADHGARAGMLALAALGFCVGSATLVTARRA
jgi:hypothetical protein